MVLSPAPIAETTKEEPVKRSLAYEQAISTPREDTDKTDAGKTDIPDFETVTREDVPAPEASDPPAIQDIPADGADAGQDFASLPDESADAQDPMAVPPLPGEANANPWGTDGAEQWGDERRPPDPYATQQGDPYGAPQDEYYARRDDPYGPPPGDPYREDEPYDPYAADRMNAPPPDPYAAQDPYGQQQQPWNGQGQAQGQWPEQNGEEWVQVIGSGTGMRASASEEAPILFAFPYGRQLKVVSRNAEWVEVIDPKSSATGWMQAHTLGPSRAPGQTPYGQNEAYYEEQPQERPGLFRRGGFADMINRALGGGN
jgi:Bacterial SH3 domain